MSISFLNLNLFLHDMTGANGTELVKDVIWMVLNIIFIFVLLGNCDRLEFQKILSSKFTYGME